METVKVIAGLVGGLAWPVAMIIKQNGVRPDKWVFEKFQFYLKSGGFLVY